MSPDLMTPVLHIVLIEDNPDDALLVDRGATFYFTIPDLHVSYPVKGEQP